MKTKVPWTRILCAVVIGLSSGWLAACGAGSANPANPDTAPTWSEIATATAAPTQRASSTATTAPSQTSTVTHTPSITATPTEDLSFYEAAECLPTDTSYQKARVIQVTDGDTIVVQFTEGITHTVRYIGIDAPESGLPLSEAASRANAELLMNKEATLISDQSDSDPFNRLLRYVVVGRVFVNQELVRQGLARAANYPPDEACKEAFANAEQEAKQALAGLWAATPTPEPFAGQVIIVSVNKREEWVDIQNVGDYDVDLAGWNLVSERGSQDCPLSGVLPAGQVLRIWAMTGEGAGFSCGYKSPIWNNSEVDPAVLYNSQGVEVDRK